MKEKGRTWVMAAILVIAVCFGTAAVGRGKSSKTAEWEFTQDLNRLSFLETGEKTEGSLCLAVHEGDSASFFGTLFGEYIVFESAKNRRYLPEGGEEYITEYEKVIFDFYNYRTGKMEKTLDLIAMAAEYTPGKQYCSGPYAVRMDGKRYLRWKIDSIKEPRNHDLTEYVFYDFDEGRVADGAIINEDEFTEEEKAYYKSFFILRDRHCNFLEVNGFVQNYSPEYQDNGIYVIYTGTWREGIIEVVMLASSIPGENSRLHGEFPGLKGYQPEGGEQVKFCFAGYPDAEEVLGMLVEEGTEITFEGCVLDAWGSVDGKEHKISSMDDYIKWRNWKLVNENL